MLNANIVRALAVGIGVLGAVASTAPGADTEPSEADVTTFGRERDELAALEALRDYAGLERLAVSIYENREHPIKDKALRSQLLAEMMEWIGQPPGEGHTGLGGLARRYGRELLAHPDELLPESEAEIVCRTPWVPTAPGVPEGDEERLQRAFMKNDRAEVVRRYFRALQRLEKGIDPNWKPGQEPGWLPGKPNPDHLSDDFATWKQKLPWGKWHPLPPGLTQSFYSVAKNDPSKIADPALRAAYMKAAEANEENAKRFLRLDIMRDALSEFVPRLEFDVARLYSIEFPSVPGSREELDALFEQFKVDAGMRARIRNKISEFDEELKPLYPQRVPVGASPPGHKPVQGSPKRS